MTLLRKAEYHEFGGTDTPYLYLVPSAAVIRLDDTASAVLDAVGDGEMEFAAVSRGAERPVGRRARQERRRGAGDGSRPQHGHAGAAETHSAETSQPSPAKRRVPLTDARPQCDEQVQPVVRLLLRVRRGQARRGEDQAAVHERRDGAAERRLHVRRVGRLADGAPDVLRRRDAAQLQDAQVVAHLCA